MFFKKKKIEVVAPFSGNIINLEEVADPVFANKVLGDGFALIPETQNELNVTAPISGVLTTTMDSGHAYGITEKSAKVECLVHIGMDTVELNGKGFDVKVAKDQQILATDLLVVVDLKVLKENKKEITTPVIFTNDSMGKYSYKFVLTKHGKVQQGEVVGEIIKK